MAAGIVTLAEVPELAKMLGEIDAVDVSGSLHAILSNSSLTK